jgi:hypothetical protein
VSQRRVCRYALGAPRLLKQDGDVEVALRRLLPAQGRTELVGGDDSRLGSLETRAHSVSDAAANIDCHWYRAPALLKVYA